MQPGFQSKSKLSSNESKTNKQYEHNDLNLEEQMNGDELAKKTNKTSFRTESMKKTLSAMNPKRCCKLISDLRRNLGPFKAQSLHHASQLPVLDDSSLSSLDTATMRSVYGDELEQDDFDGPDNHNIVSKSKLDKRKSRGKSSAVSSLDLFKYTNLRERIALCVGALCMLYAASWQPISVFILATMATLMGKYEQKIDLLNEMACKSGMQTQTQYPRVYSSSSSTTSASSHRQADFVNQNDTEMNRIVQSALLLNNSITTNSQKLESAGLINESDNLILQSSHQVASTNIMQTLESLLAEHANLQTSQSSSYDDKISFQQTNHDANESASPLPLLKPISRFITPLLYPTQQQAQLDGVNINSAIGDLFELEKRSFLRQSFELNGSAFMLAQTQLISFFLGISLIAWAARQQASRVKCLFFKSCLEQELNWFESRPDDAAGLGSSLNTLVGKYEDGIGVKLALLCYFIGHILLFALVAFCEMPQLALFCMPFVLLVWLVIVYLSNLQSIAIGESSMFAKRSLQLAEEIIMAIRTVFAFNGQQNELNRFKQTQEPVYQKSLVKHFYTALNTSLSKFSIFACFSAYCFYASRLFPPYVIGSGPANRASVLAVMRGAEVSIVNILISIPFMEALQQSRGCIACIYQIIERKSRINPTANLNELDNTSSALGEWDGSLSLKQVYFSYSQRPQLAHFRRRASKMPQRDVKITQATQQQQQQDANLPKQELSASALQADNGSNASKQPASAVSIDMQPQPQTKRTVAHDLPNVDASLAFARTVRSLSDADRDALLGSQQRILSGLSFEIKAGQSVALVGPSGSGKSTVLALVQRLYDVHDGHLLIGRRDIRTLPPAWLRNQIGVVTQEPRLFDLSISENIRLGLSRHQETMWDESFIQQQVIEAATQAGAHNFIVKLPMSYETRVGSGGVQLSGGQKQRIAIARALIRRPKLLLLDECTSALDSESEAQVQSALRAASSGKTTLIVAHHLSTIKHCDLIVVVERGRVVERGSHKELMSAFGLYRRLWEEQLRQRGNSSSPSSLNQSNGNNNNNRQLLASKSNGDSLSDSSCSNGNTNSFVAGNVISISSSDNSSVPSSTGSSMDLGQPLTSGNLNYTELVSNAASGLDQLSNAMQRLNTSTSATGNRKVQLKSTHSEHNNKSNILAQGEDLDELDEEQVDCVGELKSSRQNTPHSIGAKFNKRKFSILSTAPSQLSLEDDKVFEPHFRVQTVKFWQLWKFIGLPKWASLAAIFACLLSGLILPMNLIAHSYLFAAFAYKTPEQLAAYIQQFGLWVLSFSALVFLISVTQIVLPGYVGERLSKRMRIKIMQSLLIKPIFYFDLQINSAGALVDKFNNHISNIQSIAGSRVATLLEACSCLIASGLFGFTQSTALSLFCLTFALIVLCTTMLESRLMQFECKRETFYDVQAANLMADALSNIRTITSLNGETFFIRRFSNIMLQRKAR